MMNILKNNFFYIILFLILIYKGVFINAIANINLLLTSPNDNETTEIRILKEDNIKLKRKMSQLLELVRKHAE